MKESELQAKLDVEKWLQSESNGRDMCGEYEYCAYCQNEEEVPCASAYARMTAAKAKKDAKAETVETKKAPSKKPAKKTATKKTTKKVETKTEVKAEEVKAPVKEEKVVEPVKVEKVVEAVKVETKKAPSKKPAKKTSKK